MAIPEKCGRILALLERVKRYNAIVVSDSFSDETISEMKANAKDIIGEAKTELDEVKSEVDKW